MIAEATLGGAARAEKQSLLPAILAILVVALVVPTAVRARTALLLDVKGPIGPATAEYIERGLANAESQDGGGLQPGQAVCVKEMDGLTLIVEPQHNGR